MSFVRFAVFSVSGGILWVVSVLTAGYLFGKNPFVKNHFEVGVLAVVIISVLPAILHWLKSRGQASPDESRRLEVAAERQT